MKGMETMKKRESVIAELVMSQVNRLGQYKKEIINSLQSLLSNRYAEYDFINSDNHIELAEEKFQDILSHINEKTGKRKEKGVYYTPNDVARYIIANTIIAKCIDDNKNTYNLNDSIELLMTLEEDKINEILYNVKLIDPTCGAGEFLLNAAWLKYEILKNKNDKNILNICKTIYGNDIDEESTDISKIRIFFYFASKLTEARSFNELAKILRGNFYNVDFITENEKINKKFDITIGNPPYVEYGKYDKKTLLKNDFGNVYADVIKNSIQLLDNDGTFGYIVPISYTSTPRMGKIRKFVMNNTSKQFILNFADRPDCLFNGVHQKLNIVIAKCGKKEHKLYTSNYKHWYKQERDKLLLNRKIRECKYIDNDFIPKIGNEIEESIFKKIYTNTGNNIFDSQTLVGNPVYLNMRACFWIKAFSFNPGSNEYKKFVFNDNEYYFVLALLNSSLFWMYWTMMSDCWHITTKELKRFYVPCSIGHKERIKKLALELEKDLDATKKYVGTKQIEYEYKHKLCKKVIDQIDDTLAEIYGLTLEETDYVKKFAVNYRMGEDNV